MASGIIAVEDLPALHCQLEAEFPSSSRRPSENSSSGISSQTPLSSQNNSPTSISSSANHQPFVYENNAFSGDADDQLRRPVGPLPRFTGVLAVQDPLDLSKPLPPGIFMKKEKETKPNFGSKARAFLKCKCSSLAMVVPALDEPHSLSSVKTEKNGLPPENNNNNNNNVKTANDEHPKSQESAESSGERREFPMIIVYVIILILILAIVGMNVYSSVTYKPPRNVSQEFPLLRPNATIDNPF